jgi:hypothetical protein
MKVSSLISILKTMPKDMEVVMASDEEGNSFSPLADVVTGLYMPTATYCGEFTEGLDGITKDDEAAVCLWPSA